MTWVAVGVGGAAALGTGAQMFGAGKASDAQEAAAKAAINANRPFLQRGYQANEELGAMMGFDPSRVEKRRWAKDIKNELKAGANWKSLDKAGKNALVQSELQKQLDERSGKDTYGFLNRRFGMNDYQADPGYEFRLGEGVKALERSAAARGGVLGGAQQRALARFGQDYGSNEYLNAYNRYNADQTNMYNRLANMAGMGQTAAQYIGNAQMQRGDAQAAGYMGQANALSGGLQQASGLAGMFGPSGNMGMRR